MTQADETVEKVLEQHRAAIMALPNVIGVGLGKCGADLCIEVMVSVRSDELEDQLEALLDGYPYSINETEPLQTLPSAREP